MGVVGWALLVACGFVGCGSTSDGGGSDADSDQNLSWFCQEDSSGCECRAFPPGTMHGGSNEVEQCGAYDCCLYSNEGTEEAEATCTCLITEATCEQEAATRPGTAVVPTCPPGTLPAAVMCAAEGENCRSDYLRQNDLEGCCDGTLCEQDANGIPTCQTATTEELALHARCDALTNGSELEDLDVQPNTLVTSHGELTIGEVGLAIYSTGPGGCLNEFWISIGDLGCGLDFEGSVVGGVLTVTDVSGFLDSCPGFTGPATEGYVDHVPEVVTAFSFDGLSCDAGLVFDSYCIAGTLTFTLGGTAGALTFEPQILTIEGAMCDFGEVSGTCPTSG